MFEKNGIEVHDLEFQDGSCPPYVSSILINNAYLKSVMKQFIRICEEVIGKGGAVAVHCRAGLGRTGTLIGCYIINKYGFDPQALIGWLRIARPGSVIGHQQHFLCEDYKKIKQLVVSTQDKSLQEM